MLRERLTGAAAKISQNELWQRMGELYPHALARRCLGAFGAVEAALVSIKESGGGAAKGAPR